jgi:hypothetical protein
MPAGAPEVVAHTVRNGDLRLACMSAGPPADWVSHFRVAHVPEGAHWVHHDAPERVASLLIEHFRA